MRHISGIFPRKHKNIFFIFSLANNKKLVKLLGKFCLAVVSSYIVRIDPYRLCLALAPQIIVEFQAKVHCQLQKLITASGCIWCGHVICNLIVSLCNWSLTWSVSPYQIFPYRCFAIPRRNERSSRHHRRESFGKVWKWFLENFRMFYYLRNAMTSEWTWR